jgi:hypothetical protein
MAPLPDKDWLRPKEIGSAVAERIGCDPRAGTKRVYRAVAMGQLAGQKIAGSWAIPREEACRFVGEE